MSDCLMPVSALLKYFANSSHAVSSISVIEMLTSMDRSLVAGRACLLTGHVRIDRTFSLAQVRDGDTASWKSFFFKDKPRKMKISVCPVSGGWITVYSDYMYGTPVARFQVPEGDGLHFITLEAPTQVRPEGLTTLRMRFSGPEDRDLFTIGSFVFE